MRTTIDLPQELLARTKEVAAAERCRLSDVVADALRQKLDAPSAVREPREPFKIVPFDGGGFHPGLDLSSNGSIEDFFMEEARDAETGELDVDKLRGLP